MSEQTHTTGQIACGGCRVTLAYPIGAPSVRCPMCSAITPVQQFTVICICCRCILILPQNTSLAMCPQCRTVMSIPASIREGQFSQEPPKECVYIERPGLDSTGRLMTRISVGTKMENTPRAPGP
ncbi:hypothetical protein TRVL_07754 [Trypanosoma vivax]|uniref:Zinc finger LSD1-type domain-containing protein n=1 Tax=Trypanosoma vivax (strain Y486) TaxID=1055687 RepID=G0TZS8_TRYVY|nr:hypothetical protein TRVL_07754 [Trypanosoma vivax]CCC50106.1 conserved hypothetical protein, unlikey [Trypanosoma vivax Y486]